MKTITCDHCRITVAATEGARNTSKPEGWTRINMALKTEHGKNPTTIGYDICPTCIELVRKFIEDQHG